MSRREKEAQLQRQQRINQLNQQAQQYITNSRQTHINKPVKHLEWASNTYVGYGYKAVTGLGMMGACIGLSSRFAFLGNMASLIALGSGFVLGGFVHTLHITAAQALVMKGIDAAMPEVEELDTKYNAEGCKEYANYVSWMKQLKLQMSPQLAMMEQAKEANLSIDDRVDDIIAKYEARKGTPASK